MMEWVSTVKSQFAVRALERTIDVHFNVRVKMVAVSVFMEVDCERGNRTRKNATPQRKVPASPTTISHYFFFFRLHELLYGNANAVWTQLFKHNTFFLRRAYFILRLRKRRVKAKEWHEDENIFHRRKLPAMKNAPFTFTNSAKAVLVARIKEG